MKICSVLRIFYLNSQYQFLRNKSSYLKEILNWRFLWGDICKTRDRKSRKHASITCGQLLTKLWTSLDEQQIFCSFFCPSMATSLHYLTKINLLFVQTHQKCNLGHFKRIMTCMKSRTFINPDIWLADRNKLFPCLYKTKLTFFSTVMHLQIWIITEWCFFPLNSQPTTVPSFIRTLKDV